MYSMVIDCFTGKAFNDGIEFVFEHRQIEDLWIPYFCITTDISDSSMKAHTHGKVPVALSLISYGKTITMILNQAKYLSINY